MSTLDLTTFKAEISRNSAKDVAMLLFAPWERVWNATAKDRQLSEWGCTFSMLVASYSGRELTIGGLNLNISKSSGTLAKPSPCRVCLGVSVAYSRVR